MEIIQLKGVTKEFGKKIILDNVNFSVEEGDIFGIIGQSGSGKSTLLNLLIGFYEPDEGQIFYSSNAPPLKKFSFFKKPTLSPTLKSVHKNLPEVKKRFGFASQHPSFYPKLTVRENLIHFGKLHGIKKATLNNNIDNLLEVTHLKNHQHKLAEHISGGMQKRLNLSCSLIHKPKLLILDEPTADLDPVLQKEILHLIQHANHQGITIIVASHHLNEIEQICNKVALLHQGQITNWGTIEDIKRPYLRSHQSIHLHMGEHHQKIMEKIKNLSFTKLVDKGDSMILYSPQIHDTFHQLTNLFQTENISPRSLKVKTPSLQEIFEIFVQEKNQTPQK